MKNTTISLDETLLELARKAAAVIGLSFNAYVKKLLEDAVLNATKKNMQSLLQLSSKIQGDSKGQRFDRDETYER